MAQKDEVSSVNQQPFMIKEGGKGKLVDNKNGMSEDNIKNQEKTKLH